jgi:hypothetical protein
MKTAVLFAFPSEVGKLDQAEDVDRIRPQPAVNQAPRGRGESLTI